MMLGEFKKDPFTYCLLIGIALFLWLVVSAFSRESISPGKDFPLDWAIRAGMSESEAARYRPADQSARELQRERFRTWLRTRGDLNQDAQPVE